MKRPLINLLLLTVLCLLVACQSGSTNGVLVLNPPLHKVYTYSLLKTSAFYNKYPSGDKSQQFQNKPNIDTFKLNFSLEHIATKDSLITYKLTFLDFYKTKNSRIMLKYTGNALPFPSRDPLILFDSAKFFIRGKSVEVVSNKRGIIKKVSGHDRLLKSIAVLGNETERHVRSLLSDFIGAGAITDLLNRFLSAVPGFKVREGDKWVRNTILITKAPVKHSNVYAFEQRSADTVYVTIQSLISAEQSEGGTVYMKGRGKGIAIINYATGMPYLYETRSETETNTTEKRYEYINREHFLVKQTH